MKYFIRFLLIFFFNVLLADAQDKASSAERIRIMVRHDDHIIVDTNIVESFNKYMSYQDGLIKFFNKESHKGQFSLLTFQGISLERSEPIRFEELFAHYIINSYNLFSNTPADIYYFKNDTADHLNNDHVINIGNIAWTFDRNGKVHLRYKIRISGGDGEDNIFEKSYIHHFEADDPSTWGVWACNMDDRYFHDNYRFDCIAKTAVKSHMVEMVEFISEHFSKKKN